jgi:CheY-like chemotaxis protein
MTAARAAGSGAGHDLLTASARPGLEDEALAAGAAAVLRKPVSAAELRSLMARFFPARQDMTADEVDARVQAAFRDKAAAELQDQLARLITAVELAPPSGLPGLAADAHRNAGLAAQFGWSDLAGALEALEAALLAGPALVAAPLARLRREVQAVFHPA